MEATKLDAEKFVKEVFKKLLHIKKVNSKEIAILVLDFIIDDYNESKDDNSIRRYEYCILLKSEIEKL